MNYQVGDLARMFGTFRDVDGDLMDPSAVNFFFTSPGEPEETLVYGVDAGLARDSLGKYHVDLDLYKAGKWLYRWETTGTGQAAEFGEFDVEAQATQTWILVSLDKAKTHLHIRDTTAHDDDVRMKIAQASAIVMNHLKLTEVPATWSPQAPFVVEAAVLLVTADLFRERESGASPLSGGVRALLSMFRDPTLA